MSMHKNFSRTAIVVALSAIFPMSGAYAEDDLEALLNPNTAEAAFKLPYIDKINPLYRQYNGVNHQGVNGNLDINVTKRSEDGTWFKLQAENLGLSTQEFGMSYEKQGDWGLGLEYNQIPRYSPYQVNSATTGIGSNTLTQGVANTPASGLTEYTLKTQRDITTLTASKYLLEGLKLRFSFKNEDKSGTRLSGLRGANSSPTYNYQNILFAVEPIDQSHQQLEATLDYSTAKYQLTLGYYGSFLNTKNNSLSINSGTGTTVGGSATAPNTLISPIALAPDNSAQQIYVNGAYNFSRDTRANLKISYTEGRQNDSFISGQTAAIGMGSNLDASVQTTEVFGSLTSRITKDFKVLASWRYEDKNDKTPIRTFYASYPNNPQSYTANWAKVEGDYNLGAGYAVTAGFDYRSKTNSSPLKYVQSRADVDEKTLRLALRKAMSETVNGSLTLAHSERQGSGWQNATKNLGDEVWFIYPAYLSDRSQDKIRAMVDWAASEKLSLQFAYEAYFDNYDTSSTGKTATASVAPGSGLDKGSGQVFSLDGSFIVNDNWKMNAWYSKQLGETEQSSYGRYCTTADCVGVNRVAYNSTLKLNGDQFGFGVDGKIRMVQVGAQYLYSRDTNKQELALGWLPATPTAGTGVLPDTEYTQQTFKLFGVYPVAKTTKLRLDYIYDLRKMDDYTWRNFVYGDGTRVFVDPKQTTQIFGLTLIQSF